MKLLLLLPFVLLFTSCTLLKYEFDSKNVLPKNQFNNFELSNDSLSIEVWFSDTQKSPAFTLFIRNKLDEAFFINWDKSMVETQSQKFPFYYETIKLATGEITPNLVPKAELVLPLSTANSIANQVFQDTYLNEDDVHRMKAAVGTFSYEYTPLNTPEVINFGLNISFQQQGGTLYSKYFYFNFYLKSVTKVAKRNNDLFSPSSGNSFYLTTK